MSNLSICGTLAVISEEQSCTRFYTCLGSNTSTRDATVINILRSIRVTFKQVYLYISKLLKRVSKEYVQGNPKLAKARILIFQPF